MASKSYELMDLLESFPPISGDFIFLEGKKRHFSEYEINASGNVKWFRENIDLNYTVSNIPLANVLPQNFFQLQYQSLLVFPVKVITNIFGHQTFFFIYNKEIEMIFILGWKMRRALLQICQGKQACM